MVSDVEKAAKSVSGADQEGERKRIAEDVSKGYLGDIKTGGLLGSGKSLAGARLLARWCPAWRRREPDPGFCMERENVSSRHSCFRESAGGERKSSKQQKLRGVEYRCGARGRTGL